MSKHKYTANVYRLITGNAWTVKIGEGSGPINQGPLTNFRQNLSKFVKICQNLSKFVKIRQNLGSGPRFMVVDPEVHYQVPLPSPILMVQALHNHTLWPKMCWVDG